MWSNRNGEPLRQMQSRGENMQDVRSMLGVKSVRGKIEKRVYERIGHVMRMDNEKITKAMVLGWYERLEETEGGWKKEENCAVLEEFDERRRNGSDKCGEADA